MPISHAEMATNGDPIEQLRTIWDDAAHRYDREPNHRLQSNRLYWAWRRVLGSLFDPIQGAQPLRILDVGTGTGTMATLLANMGNDVTGVDISSAMLEEAKRKAELLGLPVVLREAAAHSLPFGDASFDAVFSRHLFWTLPEPHAALGEWARVVRPGGIVAIADGWWNEPARETDARHRLSQLLKRVLDREPASFQGYTGLRTRLPLAGGVSPYSIRYWLDTAGLERLRVRNLRSVQAAERQMMPLWRRIDVPYQTWLASGYRPE